jgi:hypothetical protein
MYCVKNEHASINSAGAVHGEAYPKAPFTICISSLEIKCILSARRVVQF